MSAKFTRPSKLCKRTHFLRTPDSVPTQSQMRHELESNLANVILKLMSPACQQWMGVDRKLKGPTIYCADSDELKDAIHEHILKLGQEAEDKRSRRRKRVIKKKNLNEEVEFLKFECRQKIEIARQEEQNKMQVKLSEAKSELEYKFSKMNSELGDDYLRARREMAKFMCKNFRKQAANLIERIVQQYRRHLEQEVRQKVNEEVQRMTGQIDEVVRAAVDHQKDLDTKAMQRMCYRYEELIQNFEHREAFHALTELSQRICSRLATLCRSAGNQETSCQTSFINPEHVSYQLDANNSRVSIKTDYLESSDYLEEDDIFIVEACFMTPDPSPVYSPSEVSLDSARSSSSSEPIYDKYSQFRCKMQEQLSLLPMVSWAPFYYMEQSSHSIMETSIIGSNNSRDSENNIVEDEKPSEREIQVTKTDLQRVSPPESFKTSSAVASESSISELFALNKSNTAIDVVVNGITLKYIRANRRNSE
ncbi:uncharacterized protein LOC129729441 [Wyeomyia smithii]|uniref:uncharacterized protein LOC129729441 n=1 Tax=Wyeomyia smithii TaxID=174621 RepID=UPI002467CF67|nr:uncharacterized protein LOC129729441 [Wyeomyia smithii]